MLQIEPEALGKHGRRDGARDANPLNDGRALATRGHGVATNASQRRAVVAVVAIVAIAVG